MNNSINIKKAMLIYISYASDLLFLCNFRMIYNLISDIVVLQTNFILNVSVIKITLLSTVMKVQNKAKYNIIKIHQKCSLFIR